MTPIAMIEDLRDSHVGERGARVGIEPLGVGAQDPLQAQPGVLMVVDKMVDDPDRLAVEPAVAGAGSR